MSLLTGNWGITQITPRFYQDNHEIGVEFARNLYPFKDEDPEVYNEKMFATIHSDMRNLFQYLFESHEDIALVLDLIGDTDSSEEYITGNSVQELSKMAIFDEVMTQSTFSQVEEGPQPGVMSEEKHVQLTYMTNVQTVLNSDALMWITNHDFPDRRPQLIDRQGETDWLIHFVGEKIVFNPYDDRGASVIFKTKDAKQHFMNEYTGDLFM